MYGCFDPLNLLIEQGADLSIKTSSGRNSFDEMVTNDNVDLLACVWSLAKKQKRDYKTVRLQVNIKVF